MEDDIDLVEAERIVQEEEEHRIDLGDDEDFEPVVVNKIIPSANLQWNDEEEDIVQQEVKPVVSAAALEAARKKAEKEELALQNQLKFSIQENETAEERRIRERNQVEEADHKLSSDLFDKNGETKSQQNTNIAAGLGGIPLKTKQDHASFAILCSKKMTSSSSLMIATFYKGLFEKVTDKLSTESIDEILEAINKVREERKKTEAKKQAPKKTKKEIDAEKKKHADVFGDTNYTSKYDHLTSLEDDFM